MKTAKPRTKRKAKLAEKPERYFRIVFLKPDGSTSLGPVLREIETDGFLSVYNLGTLRNGRRAIAVPLTPLVDRFDVVVIHDGKFKEFAQRGLSKRQAEACCSTWNEISIEHEDGRAILIPHGA